MKEWTIGELLKETKDYLVKKGISEPRLSSELLLADILKMKRLDLYLKFDRKVTQDELDRYRDFIKRRIKGEPVQYIIGKTEFFGLSFHIDRSVLIPRPESEFLVEKAIDYFKKRDGGIIIDIGTGSGVIGISVAYYSPNVKAVLSDISEDAIRVASLNAEKLLEVGDRFMVNKGDLFEGIEEKGDIITANLPYLNREQIDNLQKEVRSEPISALYGGEDGLDLIKRLIDEAEERMNEGGELILEFDEAGKEGLEIFLKNKGLEYTLYKDYNNLYRYCIIEY
ncbi:MAG TPA: peptide chain release factor N(5)-glutamine methyltransferase [Firmicutes bacterium]|uniref:Release factor glutamine methyltransferase n=1 Tax=candidate division TA06 bacterium TaxID=2250710 RepID=A0A660S5N9_UNCT6|nr:MAG: peptide chain release factor N(5)-glutamine methyltransferase [candidate division TA06 bacterium]HFD04670.1 peptide chain release factor N(5)-glutamine methyltransferase [Bacillota bacterium]